MNEKNKALLQMTICAIMWSSGGIILKFVPWNSMVIAGWRSFFAVFTILIFMKAAKMKISFHRKTVFTGVFLAATYCFFIIANKLTTAANAIVLQFTSPIFIILISVLFLHQKLHWQDATAVGLAVLGIALFFVDSLGTGSMLGNAAGVCSGIVLAVMYTSAGRLNNDERMSSILIGNIITAAVGIPFMLVYKTEVTLLSAIWVVVLGVFQLGLPYILYGLSARICSPLMCSLIGALEPLLNPVWVFLFDGEAPGVFALVGGVIVIVTVTVWCIWQGRASHGEQTPCAQPNAAHPQNSN